MTPEELKQAVDEVKREAQEARQKLYKAIGRETAYILLGAVGASVVWGLLTWGF